MEKTNILIAIDLPTLLDLDIEGLNNYLDEQLEKAGITHIATDISYEPISVDGQGNIKIKAT